MQVGSGFYTGGERCPEDVPFPSCLRACLEVMGESYGCKHVRSQNPAWRGGCTYAYIMGTSGSAFRLSWRPGWHEDNVEIMYMSADPGAPFRRAFGAVGHAHEIIHKEPGEKEEGRDNKAYLRSRIAESIRDEGRPVIAFGVIGPPESCIVAGYDEHGDVLIGWNFFQGFPEFSAGVEFEPSGYFRKRDWFKDTERLIIIGEKQERPLLASLRPCVRARRLEAEPRHAVTCQRRKEDLMKKLRTSNGPRDGSRSASTRSRRHILSPQSRRRTPSKLTPGAAPPPKRSGRPGRPRPPAWRH